jgi:hypothetical protein
MVYHGIFAIVLAYRGPSPRHAASTGYLVEKGKLLRGAFLRKKVRPSFVVWPSSILCETTTSSTQTYSLLWEEMRETNPRLDSAPSSCLVPHLSYLYLVPLLVALA